MNTPFLMLAVALLGATGSEAHGPLLLPGVCGGTPSPAMTDQAQAPPTLAAQEIALRLNLPSFTLELYRGPKLLRRYTVAIGDTAYPTPVGSFEVTRVDWDPWWIPPASEWAQHDTVTPPGPANPMGRVRLFFRDLYFVHGTPYRGSLGTLASHGCVRLSNSDAVDLARRVLAYGAPKIPATEVAKLAARRGTTRQIPLERPVRLQIRYEVAAVHNGKLTIYPDVYHVVPCGSLLDTVLAAAHRALGDSFRVDTGRVLQILERAGRKPVAVDIKALMPAVPLTP